MGSRTITWEFEPLTARHRPRQHVLVQSRVDPSADWSAGNPVPDPETSITFPDLDPGEWFWRLTVVDVSGASSPGVEVSSQIDFDDPDDVINVNVS